MNIYTSDGNAPDAELGGKAAGLRHLRDTGYSIPEWFVVPGAGHANDSLDANARDRIIGAARDLAAGGLLAVRSSARDEDGARHSFAGQFETVLAVSPEAVPAAVERVWNSALTQHGLAYREEHGLAAPVAPAVLVQRQLDPDTAGVAFSVDPVDGRWDEALVSAVPGCGTALVNGDTDADTWHICASGQVARRTIARKSVRHDLCSETDLGVKATPLADAVTDKPCLDDAQAIEVAAMARSVARLRGVPQDIEFAYVDGKLHLLQSRPITTLGRVADPNGQLALWDNANIAESYGGITSPLTYSFARHAYEHVYRQFCRLLGVDAATISANGHLFGAMIGLIRGRVYYNLLNWHRLLALLPGYQLNQHFMEQMMGVDEALGEAIRPTPAGTPKRRTRELLRLVRTGVGLLGSFFGVERSIKRFTLRLDEALAEPAVALADQRLDELACHYRMLESRLLSRWDAPLTNDLLAMIFYGATRALSRRWLGDAAGTLQNDLIGGEGGVISTEPAALVRAMAETVRGDARWIEMLGAAPARDIVRSLDSRPAFQHLFNTYLQRFGDRCLDELKLESLPLDEDPEPLFRAVAAFASRPAGEHTNHATSARAKAMASVDGTLTQPLKRRVFKWFLKHARRRVRCRENLRFERTRLFGRVRRVVVEMGKRLTASGALESPRDVFFLELQELLGFVEGTSTCVDLKGLVRVRKQHYATFELAPEPGSRFKTTGAVHVGNTFTTANPTVVAAGTNVQTGTGACPGVVRGRARVVRDPRGVTLEAGAILVAERTDPGWIMLFPAAAGLVVERGSLLSHSAIVARELGLPAVVGVANATTWLKDGDLIELDGTSGAVSRIEEESCA